jgi:hypothetical protein
MFKKIREYRYIRKIRKAMAEPTMLKYLKLNGYKTRASYDLIDERISAEFYKAIFVGGTTQLHYTEVNAENINNYTFFKKRG